eukprot:scaffold13562_cov63-Phaeocystis_antarctica.AAC.5
MALTALPCAQSSSRAPSCSSPVTSIRVCRSASLHTGGGMTGTASFLPTYRWAGFTLPLDEDAIRSCFCGGAAAIFVRYVTFARCLKFVDQLQSVGLQQANTGS